MFTSRSDQCTAAAAFRQEWRLSSSQLPAAIAKRKKRGGQPPPGGTKRKKKTRLGLSPGAAYFDRKNLAVTHAFFEVCRWQALDEHSDRWYEVGEDNSFLNNADDNYAVHANIMELGEVA